MHASRPTNLCQLTLLFVFPTSSLHASLLQVSLKKKNSQSNVFNKVQIINYNKCTLVLLNSNNIYMLKCNLLQSHACIQTNQPMLVKIVIGIVCSRDALMSFKKKILSDTRKSRQRDGLGGGVRELGEPGVRAGWGGVGG